MKEPKTDKSNTKGVDSKHAKLCRKIGNPIKAGSGTADNEPILEKEQVDGTASDCAEDWVGKSTPGCARSGANMIKAKRTLPDVGIVKSKHWRHLIESDMPTEA